MHIFMDHLFISQVFICEREHLHDSDFTATFQSLARMLIHKAILIAAHESGAIQKLAVRQLRS